MVKFTPNYIKDVLIGVSPKEVERLKNFGIATVYYFKLSQQGSQSYYSPFTCTHSRIETARPENHLTATAL